MVDLLHKGLELFLGQRDGVGQQLLDKPHALAEAVRPVLALLLFLLLDQPLFPAFKGASLFVPDTPARKGKSSSGGVPHHLTGVSPQLPF